MFSCFIDAYTKEISQHNKQNQQWIDLMVQIPRATTKWNILKSPKSKFRKIFYDIAIHKNTEIVILTITMINLICLAIDYEDSTELYIFVLEIINEIITFIFIAELIIKITVLGFVAYFSNNWNRFDFIIVLTSLVDIYFLIAKDEDFSTANLLRTLQILRILRIIRVTR